MEAFVKGGVGVVQYTIRGAWLSTLAVQHSLPLCSRDAHFEKVPQIARI